MSGVMEAVEEIMAVNVDSDPAVMLEQMSDLQEYPVNINGGDEKEIGRLFFLTEFQIMVLTDHVRRNGKVVSLYELALLPAFDRNTVMLMAPFISLQSAKENGRKGYGRTTVTTTVSTHHVSVDDEPPGTRSMLRMKHDGNKLSLGLTAENDPGESFTFTQAVGPDFLSAFLMYENNGLIKRIIIGDYSLRFDEGLLFNSSSWQGSWLSSTSFMTGKSSATHYTSSEENSFLRGVSIVIGGLNAGATLFASSNKIDARPILNTDSIATAVTNLVNGGIHVSDAQCETRKILTERVAGLHLTVGNDKMRGGVTASVTCFSLPFLPDTSKAENIHAFAGSRLINLSAGFKAGTGPVLLFAEAALSMPGSWAATGGIRLKPSGRVTWNILARHFSPDYYAFHSGAFKVVSGPGNETGIAASVHVEAARHLFLTTAADHYRILWPRYRSSSPSYGNRAEIRGEYRPREDISLRLSFTSSSRDYDLPVETGTAAFETRAKRLLAFIFSYDLTDNAHFTTRASASVISPSEEKGYLLCQDISYSFRAVPLRLWLRYALCTTEGYDSRLYAWENDMLSSFSVQAMYGESNRTYLMISWKPLERVEIRAKYAVSLRDDVRPEILRQEFKGQVRLEF